MERFYWIGVRQPYKVGKMAQMVAEAEDGLTPKQVAKFKEGCRQAWDKANRQYRFQTPALREDNARLVIAVPYPELMAFLKLRQGAGVLWNES